MVDLALPVGVRKSGLTKKMTEPGEKFKVKVGVRLIHGWKRYYCCTDRY